MTRNQLTITAATIAAMITAYAYCAIYIVHISLIIQLLKTTGW